MALTLIYRMFATLVSWMVLRCHPGSAKEIEILGLRHRLAVLQRRRLRRHARRASRGGRPEPRDQDHIQQVRSAATPASAPASSTCPRDPRTDDSARSCATRQGWRSTTPLDGRTGPCSPPSSGGCPERCVAIAWPPPTRSCAGIAASAAENEPTRTGPDGHRSTTSSPP